MPDQGMEAGVAGEDLERGARCRIALEHDGDVFTEPIEHAVIFAFPIETLKYSLQTDAVTRDSLPMSPRRCKAMSTRFCAALIAMTFAPAAFAQIPPPAGE